MLVDAIGIKIAQMPCTCQHMDVSRNGLLDHFHHCPEFNQENPLQGKHIKLWPTSTVQAVVEESFQDMKGFLTTECDLSHPELKDIAEGSIMGGFALCSPGVFTDIAFTVGDYVHRKLIPEKTEFAMNCGRMTFYKPLFIISLTKSRLLRADAVVNLSKKACELEFYSIVNENDFRIKHARCVLRYGDRRTISDLSCETRSVKPHLDELLIRAPSQIQRISWFHRKMVYKLYSEFIRYSTSFQGMAEVIMDSASLEASSRIELQSNSIGKFFMPPNHLDSLLHLAGFVMNVNDEHDLSKNVFVNSSWDSLEFVKFPSSRGILRSYVRMKATDSTRANYVGDLYIFNEASEVIGKVEGLSFQVLPRIALDRMLQNLKLPNHSSNVPTSASQDIQITKIESEIKDASLDTGTVSSDVSVRITEILAEECGLDAWEISDDIDLASIGVDSLMSLCVSQRFIEEFGLQAQINLLSECEFVKDIKSTVLGELYRTRYDCSVLAYNDW